MSYKILSLDGGGSWAILQAMALQEIYKGKSCKEILAEFDLVAANSGGSLILACMMEFDDMQKIIELFFIEKKRNKIFSKIHLFEGEIENKIGQILGIGPKYNTKRKLEGIEKSLPKYGKELFTGISEKLGLKTQFLVTAFDYDFQKAIFFSSDPLHYDNNIYENTLAQTVHASSNAPIKYFDEPAEFIYKGFNRRFWDGAMGGNNNPALVAVVEAMGVYHQKAEDIRVLSIGTANLMLPINSFCKHNAEEDFLFAPKLDHSLKNDIHKMAKCILSEPMDAATYMTHIILGGNNLKNQSHIVRLNPLIKPILKNNIWCNPDNFGKNAFMLLVDIDMDAVEQDETQIIYYLGKKWIEGITANQAIRCDSETLEPVLGDPFFRAAVNTWFDII